MPFANWLKGFYAGQKKYGSKDRKHIAHLCYSYFRLGNAFSYLPVEERLLVGLFLSSTSSLFILQELKPEWNNRISASIQEKLSMLKATHEINKLFKWSVEISDEINHDEFALSFLIQPLLFLRIRPGQREKVINKLKKIDVPFEIKSEDCVALENGTKIEDIFQLDKEIVIQDFSSQQVVQGLKAAINEDELIETWDCCAASGGKSILLKDHFPKVYLTVSDIRASIIHNLRNRFQRAGIHHYQSLVLDVSKPGFKMDKSFDVIVCDAPCSGSGTWSRTPEQMYFFDQTKIQYYAGLQKQIAENASWYIKPGGFFLYITCSVFKQENEAVVEHLVKSTSMKLISATYHKGYHQKADTLFSALFQSL